MSAKYKGPTPHSKGERGAIYLLGKGQQEKEGQGGGGGEEREEEEQEEDKGIKRHSSG